MRSKIVNHFFQHGLLYCIIAFTGWLFVFRLDWVPLTSWDEAWYGSIARNIVRTGNIRDLMFNGEHFFDHPPAGFILIAISYKFFGISEFSTRLVSALAGIGSAVLVYAIGWELYKNKYIGFAGVLILNTSVWYVIRARSGNLDVPFVFFFVLAVYFAMKTRINIRWFVPSMIAFGLLVMSKTLVGISAIIPIIWYAFPAFFQSKYSLTKRAVWVGAGFLASFFIIYPWYWFQIHTYPGFYQRHFVEIGSRGKLGNNFFESFLRLNWELPLFYLHMGVRKWYKVWVLASTLLGLHIITTCIGHISTFSKRSNKRDSLLNLLHADIGLLIWNCVILYPFITTDQTQIWHLIPVYAPLAVVTARSVFVLFAYLFREIPEYLFKNMTIFSSSWYTKAMSTVYLIMFIGLSVWQIRIFYPEVIPTSRFTPDEVSILQFAETVDSETILVDLDYFPIASYYADKRVVIYERLEGPAQTITNAFSKSESAIMMLKNETVQEYLISQEEDIELLKKNDTFSLIKMKSEQ